MTTSTKPITRADELAQFELDLAAWTAERDEKRREHQELVRQDADAVDRFADRVVQRNERLRQTPTRQRNRDAEHAEAADLQAAHDQEREEIAGRHSVVIARMDELTRLIDSGTMRANRLRAEIEAVTDAGDPDALQADLDKVTARHRALTDEFAQVGQHRGSAFLAGDPKAWRAALDAAVELPLKIALARAEMIAAEIKLTKAQLADAVERTPQLAARLDAAEAAFQLALTERNRAAAAARANGVDQQELRLEIRRLEREAAAHRASSIGKVA
jgi:chromosome segregation ATPase